MKIDRIHQIHQLLKTTEPHSVSIDELCTTFNVSKNTIRRDIAELKKSGFIKKVYGGIVLQEQSESSPEPFTSWETKNMQAKKNIARIAASLVNNGDVIYIDSGTTTMHMLPYLAEKKHLTIVTASVYVISTACSYKDFNVIATGGSLYTPSKALSARAYCVVSKAIIFPRFFLLVPVFFLKMAQQMPRC